MGKRGPQPTALGVLERRGSRLAKIKPKPLRIAAATREPIALGDLRETIKLIPGFDPHRDAVGFTFDIDRATAAIQFFHMQLSHAKGKKSRQQFALEPWQQAIIANIYGWVDPFGNRRFREVLIYIPRKNGKSTIAAGLLLLGLFGREDAGMEIYGAASRFDQATLVFQHARGMILQNKELDRQVQIFKGQAKSIALIDDPLTTYRVICADPDAAHGFNTNLAVIDELHTLPNGDLVEAMMTSTGAREQPLLVYITTADYDRESCCNQKYEYACKVRDGTIPDPRFLPVIYEAKPDADWKSPAVWRAANPNLGVSISEEYLERECKRAQETPTYENTFKRLHLNMRTQQDVRWLPLDRWDACDGLVDPAALEGKRCYGAIDLSSTQDITALVLLFQLDDEILIVPRFWIPGDNAKRREDRDRVPYVTWARQGLVTMTPGDVIDYQFIRAELNALKKIHDIAEIAYDPWNATQVAQQLQDQDGMKMIAFGQGMRDMNEPMKAMERLVVSRKIRHGGNPVLRWMVGNTAAKLDEAGNIKPDKKRSTERIDGVVATIMALGRMLAHGKKASVYEERGILTL